MYPAEANGYSQVHDRAEFDCLGWGSLELDAHDTGRLDLRSLDLQRLVGCLCTAAVVALEVDEAEA